MGPFARDYTGGRFVTFSASHWAALAVLALCIAALVTVGRRLGESGRRRVLVGIVVVLWGTELSYHAWRALSGTWTPKEMLPLHLCSVLVWASGFLLLTGNRRLYELSYFWGLAGATQALLTPDIGVYGFPHYRFFQFFVTHGLIVATAVWFTAVEAYRPTWASWRRALVTLVCYGVVVFGVNTVVGSNYLFLNRKPSSRSVLDLLPAWPGYLPYLVGMVVIAFTLFYLPWAIADARATRAARALDVPVR
ncbi:YwaF family protein [Nigerium massiliense]|uniref:YwaF family protein n=1 Tax=Nigerium massiliense TaxID=1522317 RepID=UPI00058ED06A|nr:TIGR02206 family membrane protein [Nigerium massiliense]